ncbi:MAG: hypothetical protein KGJ02_07860 [Verrucomicrobiota bacterium]|nr:hypothetical protein [Verrucomicrobiota bacterium]
MINWHNQSLYRQSIQDIGEFLQENAIFEEGQKKVLLKGEVGSIEWYYEELIEGLWKASRRFNEWDKDPKTTVSFLQAIEKIKRLSNQFDPSNPPSCFAILKSCLVIPCCCPWSLQSKEQQLFQKARWLKKKPIPNEASSLLSKA